MADRACPAPAICQSSLLTGHVGGAWMYRRPHHHVPHFILNREGAKLDSLQSGKLTIANTSAFWSEQVENWPGQVEFCVEHKDHIFSSKWSRNLVSHTALHEKLSLPAFQHLVLEPAPAILLRVQCGPHWKLSVEIEIPEKGVTYYELEIGQCCEDNKTWQPIVPPRWKTTAPELTLIAQPRRELFCHRHYHRDCDVMVDRSRSLRWMEIRVYTLYLCEHANDRAPKETTWTRNQHK